VSVLIVVFSFHEVREFARDEGSLVRELTHLQELRLVFALLYDKVPPQYHRARKNQKGKGG
jgi:hypothetical protein